MATLDYVFPAGESQKEITLKPDTAFRFKFTIPAGYKTGIVTFAHNQNTVKEGQPNPRMKLTVRVQEGGWVGPVVETDVHNLSPDQIRTTTFYRPAGSEVVPTEFYVTCNGTGTPWTGLLLISYTQHGKAQPRPNSRLG